ncbi:MAG: glycosyltransferase, partial [Giesbergeria sp.]
MKPVVILTTMVKNEHVALPRLLRSAAQVCTHVALTDTGSTDDTVSVAETVCKELGLVLDVAHEPWEDFGRSRTKNLEHGRRVASAIGDPRNCYLLLMDADMEVPPGTSPRDELPELGMMAQCDGRAVWWNIRVLRA